VSSILHVIYTTGFIRRVKEYVSAPKGLSFVDDLGWVETGSDAAQVITSLDRCATKIIKWASRRGLKFDTAKMEAALLMCRVGCAESLY